MEGLLGTKENRMGIYHTRLDKILKKKNTSPISVFCIWHLFMAVYNLIIGTIGTAPLEINVNNSNPVDSGSKDELIFKI